MSDPIDDLLAARAKADAANQGQPAGGGPDHLDKLLAARANSGPAQAAAPPSEGFWSGLGNSIHSGVMAAGHRLAGVPGATVDSGAVGNVVDAASALGHNLLALPRGLDQKLAAGAAYVTGNQKLKDFSSALNDNLSDTEKEYQGETPDSLGALVGAAAGQVAPWMLAGPAKALDAAGSAVSKVMGYLPQALAKSTAAVPYLAPVTRNAANAVSVAADAAAKGATMAVTQPVDVPVSAGPAAEGVMAATARQALAGSVLGAGAKGTGSGISAVAKPLARVINPMRVVGENLPNIAGVSPKDYITALRGPGATEWVPNSTPTVAQAGAAELGSNNAGAVQVERLLRSTVPEFGTAFSQRGIQNNDARVGALTQVAGDADVLAALKSARQAKVKPLYAAAYEKPVAGDPALGSIMDTTSFPKALTRAQAIAGDEMPPRQIVLQQSAPGGTTRSPILGSDGAPMVTSTTPGSPGMYSVEGLHDVIGALGELPSDITQGIVGKQARNVRGVQTGLRDWLTAKSPAFGKAQSAYQQASVPINNMEVAQSILDRVGGGADNTSGINPALTLTRFNNARRVALDAADHAPDADTLTQLQRLSDDLRRANVSNQGGPPGSSTALNLKSDDWLTRLMTSGPKGTASPIANALATGAGALAGGPQMAAAAMFGTNKVGSWLTGRQLQAWTDALLNPETAAAAMERYHPDMGGGAAGPLSIVLPAANSARTANP